VWGRKERGADSVGVFTVEEQQDMSPTSDTHGQPTARTAILVYSKTGGIVGWNEKVTATEILVEYTGRGGRSERRPTTTDERQALTDAHCRFRSFTDTAGDSPNVADGVRYGLSFNGAGSEEATEEQRRRVWHLAVELFRSFGDNDPLSRTGEATMSVDGLPGANRFELASGEVQITYQVVRQGRSLHYRDSQLDLTFEKEQLQTDQRESGTMVRVVFPPTSQQSQHMLDVLIPDARVRGAGVDVTAVAILTTIQGGFVPSHLVAGPVQQYRVLEFKGTARQVD